MTMNILLSEIEGGGTLMKSSMALSITGKLAQFGSRMIVAVNNKMFDQWAKNFTHFWIREVKRQKRWQTGMLRHWTVGLWPGQPLRDYLRDKRPL